MNTSNSNTPKTPETFQDLILALQKYWASYGCVVLQPLDLEVGAGTFHPEGGETWEQFETRVAEGLRDWLRKTDGDVLAVVHSGVIRAALVAFLGLLQHRLLPVTPGTGTILHFDGADAKHAKLEGYNIGLFAPQSAEAVAD